jgi:hypothetical protein
MLNAEVSETRSGVSGDNMRAGDSMHDYGNVQKRIALA